MRGAASKYQVDLIRIHRRRGEIVMIRGRKEIRRMTITMIIMMIRTRMGIKIRIRKKKEENGN